MKYLILVTVLLTGCADISNEDWNARMSTLRQATNEINQQNNQNQNSNNQNGYRQFKTTNCYQTVTGYMCNEY